MSPFEKIHFLAAHEKKSGLREATCTQETYKLLQFAFLSGSVLVSKSKYERQVARKRRLAQKRQKNKPQKIRGQMQRHKAVSSNKQGDRKGGTQVIRKHHAVFPLSPTTKGAFNFLSLQFSNRLNFHVFQFVWCIAARTKRL
jgi:hypothetical protein